MQSFGLNGSRAAAPWHWIVWVGAAIFLPILLVGPRTTASADLRSLTLAASEPTTQSVSVDTKDGLLTATFSEQTDDPALAAAIPMLNARGVESVSLRGAPIREIQPLIRLSRLRDLDISATLVCDIVPLAELTRLRSLNLQFLQIGDLAPLAGIAGMRSLSIGGTSVRDLTPLAGMTNLTGLVVAVTKVRDLTPLAGLRQLASLDLGGTSVSNLRPHRPDISQP